MNYNRELEDKYFTERTRGWSDEDLIAMAKLEAAFTGKFVNQYLQSVINGRTLESIKSKRKSPDYKALVEELKSELALPPNMDILEELQADLNVNAADEEEDEARAILVEESIFPNSSFAQIEVQPSCSNTVTGAFSELQSPGVTVAQTSDDPMVTQEASPKSLNPQAEVFVPVGDQYSSVPKDPLRTFLEEYSSRNLSWDAHDLSLITLVRKSSFRNRQAVAAELNNYVSTFNISSSTTSKVRAAGSSTKGKSVQRRRLYGRGAGGAYEYKLAQVEYHRNKKRLAEKILDGVPLNKGSPSALPSIADVAELYRNVFGAESPEDGGPIVDRRTETPEQFRPVAEEDISEAIRLTRTMAAGPDGVTVAHIRSVPVRKLVILYNSMLLFGICPQSFKANRTILIPKGGDEADVNNWRPITISSIFLRILHRIISARLANLPLHSHQRGFVKGDGVFLNTLTMNTLIKDRRQKRKPYSIISLDLRKAFDTVSHHSIRRALERFSVDPRLIRYIMESYNGSFTKVHSGSQSTDPIEIRRGVKQGDPLSPLLFNLVVDELICKLEERSQGLTVSEHLSISVLGYADDLVLFADSRKEGQRLLSIAENFFRQRGLSLNVAKCAALCVQVVPAKKTLYTVSRPLFYADGEFVKQLSPDEFFKYLGRHVTTLGYARPFVGELQAQLQRIRSAPLKPAQKLSILKGYLLPRLLHLLQSPRITLGLLKSTDKLVRKTVRLILHLPRTSTDSFIHAPSREGGLGVISMRAHIPMIMRRRIANLTATADLSTAAVLVLPDCDQLWTRLCRWTDGQGDNPRAIARDWSQRLQQSYSGNGLHQGNCNGYSGNWVDSPPKYWSGADYVNAVLLKGNALPTRGIPSNPPHERKCRAGCDRTESLSHVLQGCPMTHYPRIRRHDRTVTSLRKAAEQKGWVVLCEKRIRTSDGTLRIPDLLFFKGSRIVVCDVSVNWEGPNPLSVAYQAKVDYYSNPLFLQALQRMYPDKSICVTALVIGARGTWFSGNQKISDILGLSKSTITALICGVINGSVLIHREFMRAVYARPRRQ